MRTLSRDSTVSFLLATMGALTLLEGAPTLTADTTESSYKSETTRCGARAAEREMLEVRVGALMALPPGLLDLLRGGGADAADDGPRRAAERLQHESLACAAQPHVARHASPARCGRTSAAAAADLGTS